jgi:hypothetical protein
MTIRDISQTHEGKMLLSAIGYIMTTPGNTNKTPEDVIEMLENNVAEVDKTNEKIK